MSVTNYKTENPPKRISVGELFLENFTSFLLLSGQTTILLFF